MVSFVLAETQDYTSGQEYEQYYPGPRYTLNCWGCGRFASHSTDYGYGGRYNQIYVTTHCKKCGDITESIL